MLVQASNDRAFDRGDSVSLQVGEGRPYAVAPQRPQTAIFSGDEGERIVSAWTGAEAATVEAGLLGKVLGDAGNVVVQVRQVRGGARITRFSLKGFGLALAALTDIESGNTPPPAEAEAAPRGGSTTVDDVLRRVLELFR